MRPARERAGRILESSSRGPSLWPLLPATIALVVGGALLVEPAELLSADDYRAFDWLESAKFRWHAVQSLREGQLALWNPWLEGGMPSYAHPSDPSLSPFFMSALLFGPLLSMKLDAVVLLLLASIGSYLLARRWLSLVPSAAAMVGLSVACSGWLPSRLAVGFYESLWLGVVPLAAALVLRCVDEGGPFRGGARWLVLASLLLAAAGVQMQLCLAFAAVQLFMMATLGPSPVRGSRLLFVAAIVVAMVLVALLGAVKFLPMVELLAERGGRDGFYPRELSLLGALKAQVAALFETATVVGEYDASGMPLLPEYHYVGLSPIVGLLALLGLSVRDRRGKALGLLLLASLMLSWRSGDGAQFSLFELLAPLPVFSSVRDTARYLPFFLLLWFSLLAGLGVESLWRQSFFQRSARARKVLYVGLILCLLPGGLGSASLYSGVFSESLIIPPPSDEPFTQQELSGKPATGTQAVTREIYLAPQRGQGVLYEPEDLPPARPSAVQARSTLQPDGTRVNNPSYLGELRFQDGVGRLSPLRVGRNSLAFDLRTSGPATIVLNQNFFPGWQTEEGAEVFDLDGLLAVKVLGAWDGQLELRFAPRTLWWGLLLSALGLVLCFAFLLWGRQREPSGV